MSDLTLPHQPAPTHSPPGELSRVPYLPGLDGMRALAVVAVMVYHADAAWLSGGFLGVEVFFVISGYLITLLLLGERERTGHIDLRQFWIRRFRRLLPALIVMLALLAVYITAFYSIARGRTRGDFVAGFPFYASNWYQIWVGQGYGAGEAFAPLRHLWSLAVEEQFYLLWPLVMILLLRRRRVRDQPRLALWFGGLAIAIAILTAVLFAPGDVSPVCSAENMNGYWKLWGRCISINDALYLSSITRASGILLGAGLAMIWRPMAILRGPLRRKGAALDGVAVLGMIGLGVLFWTLHVQTPGHNFGVRFDPWLFRGGFLLTALATLLVIMAVTHRDSRIGKVLGLPLLNWIGTRSYGLYLYHWPVYQVIRKQAGIPLSVGKFVLAVVITVPLTEASYRLVETPIRKGRLFPWLRSLRVDRRVLAGSFSVVAVVVAALISMGMAKNRCVGDVECSLETARTVDSMETVGPTAPTATVAPGQEPTTTTALVTTTTLSPEPKVYAAIGESVMAGAATQLDHADGLVDAAKNRGVDGTVQAIDKHVRSGELSPTTRVAIQVGTNVRVSDADLDRIMAALPTQEVVFLTVHAPNAPWITDNNTLIKALPGRFPRVTVLDWDTRSADVKLCPDHTHISCDAASGRAYANMIFEALGLPELVK